MEGTTTLADALLDDLDDLMESDDEDQHDESQNVQDSANDSGNDHRKGSILSESSSLQESNITESLSKKELETEILPSSQFLQNPSLVKHMKIIRQHNESSSASEKSEKKVSPIRKEREEENHQLVVQSNKHLANLEEELERAHGELAKAYNPKFPELEELLPNPLHYKNAVRIIGNETDLTKVNDKLNEILTSNQIITISMAGSTTSGRLLTEDELRMVDRSTIYMEDLLLIQKELMEFVENSMESLCPSICALIGAPTAARLLGLAGGLQELTKVRNIPTQKTKCMDTTTYTRLIFFPDL